MSGIVRKQQQIPSSLSCHAQSVLICSYRDACLLCIAGSELEYTDNMRVQMILHHCIQVFYTFWQQWNKKLCQAPVQQDISSAAQTYPMSSPLPAYSYSYWLYFQIKSRFKSLSKPWVTRWASGWVKKSWQQCDFCACFWSGGVITCSLAMWRVKEDHPPSGLPRTVSQFVKNPLG